MLLLLFKSLWKEFQLFNLTMRHFQSDQNDIKLMCGTCLTPAFSVFSDQSTELIGFYKMGDLVKDELKEQA